ncbi:MAG: tRNA pseudouridine(55) synthase TruB, partial [Clostridia bacterium]|nr:tRNA pseudouridine(55) synthase TruB [Clostridia bacterium]
RKKKPDTVSGILIINKHPGVTSHRIVSAMRKLYDTPRVGHTGTLDPMATGVLPILLGRAVKASEYVMAEEKEYLAGMKLGVATDTQDVTGEAVFTSDLIPDEEEVVRVAASFVGEYDQIPPMYSAIKMGGEKLLDIARRGETVERKPRRVTIKECEAEKRDDGTYSLRVVCSKGTYVRTLCDDIGKKLGCGAAMASLVRVRSGPFTLDGSRTVEEIENMTFEERIASVTPIAALFADLPEAAPGARLTKLFACGSSVPQKWVRTSFPEGTLLRVTEDGTLIGLGRVVFENGESVIRSEKLFDLSLVPPEGSSEREKKHGEHQDTAHG